MKNFLLLFFSAWAVSAFSQTNPFENIYDVSSAVESRSISFENPTGAPGQGGQAASNLGVGRKGAPRGVIKANEEIVLCDIKSSGTIRHMWLTGDFIHFPWMKGDPQVRKKFLRSTIIRAYWDGQEHPSIECPLGDFMGLAHSKITSYQSAVHSVGEKAALNMWLPMPFFSRAKITLTNESDQDISMFYYQIDYTINDAHKEDVGRLHVCFRRENPTSLENDFVLLPKRTGKGRFVGAVIGVRTLHPNWWGEGEIKFYMDGDSIFPSICGTGSEDYIGLSWEMQNTTFNYHGANLVYTSDSLVEAKNMQTGEIQEMNRQYVSMYRWHILDPVYWKKDMKVTIQQLGCCYYERDDDWSAATFWYEPVPSAPLPLMPDSDGRIADLDELLKD